MKSTTILTFFILFVISTYGQSDNWKYLEQKPPTSEPEIFAPGIISTQDYQELGILFSSDSKEIYFGRRGNFNERRFDYEAFMCIKYVNNTWSQPQLLLSKGIAGTTFSPDGYRLYFGKNYIEKTDTGWSKEIKQLGSPFEDWGVVRSSISLNGTFYFENRFRGEYKKGQAGTYYSKLIDGKYIEPVFLVKGSHPFIALDESYLIFDLEGEQGCGSSDLYIIFKKKDAPF